MTSPIQVYKCGHLTPYPWSVAFGMCWHCVYPGWGGTTLTQNTNKIKSRWLKGKL